MNNVIAVHKTFSRNWIFRSGFWISGISWQNGLTNSRNLKPIFWRYLKWRTDCTFSKDKGQSERKRMSMSVQSSCHANDDHLLVFLTSMSDSARWTVSKRCSLASSSTYYLVRRFVQKIPFDERSHTLQFNVTMHFWLIGVCIARIDVADDRTSLIWQFSAYCLVSPVVEVRCLCCISLIWQRRSTHNPDKSETMDSVKLTDATIKSYRVTRIFQENADRINSLNFSSNGETLITSGDDDSIVLYDCLNGSYEDDRFFSLIADSLFA